MEGDKSFFIDKIWFNNFRNYLLADLATNLYKKLLFNH